LKFSKDIDSKFRFVIIASKRAKQLLSGAKPRVKSKFRNLVRIAQEEIEQDAIGFDIVRPKKEELHDAEDEDLIGQDLESEAIGEDKENQKGETNEEAEKVESEKDEEVSGKEEEEELKNDLDDEDEEK
jgi:DNA-directed RNA polymerase omega subunit